MSQRKRIGAGLLCAGLILAVFVFSAFAALEAGHDCTGEDCPVCRLLTVCRRRCG